MAEKIKYSINIQVVGGPSIPISDQINLDAYDKTQITIAKGGNDIEVVLPGLSQLFFIKASSYPDADASADKSPTLIYKVNDKSKMPKLLNGPHLFIGTGAVGMLDTAAPTKLFFSNSLSIDVTIDILIAGNVTPLPQPEPQPEPD